MGETKWSRENRERRQEDIRQRNEMEATMANDRRIGDELASLRTQAATLTAQQAETQQKLVDTVRLANAALAAAKEDATTITRECDEARALLTASEEVRRNADARVVELGRVVAAYRDALEPTPENAYAVARELLSRLPDGQGPSLPKLLCDVRDVLGVLSTRIPGTAGGEERKDLPRGGAPTGLVGVAPLSDTTPARGGQEAGTIHTLAERLVEEWYADDSLGGDEIALVSWALARAGDTAARAAGGEAAAEVPACEHRPARSVPCVVCKMVAGPAGETAEGRKP